MALIRCYECGRTISDQARACNGCGAPRRWSGAFDAEPRRSHSPPPTRHQLAWRGAGSVLAMMLGILWSDLLGSKSGNDRLLPTIAALLVVVGLCGAIVTAVQFVALRK